MKTALHDADGAVRYWAALGFLMRGAAGVEAARDELTTALDDPAPDVRIAAAEALGRFGNGTDLERSLKTLKSLLNDSKDDYFTVLAALNAVGSLGDKAASLHPTIRALALDQSPVPHPRYANYVPRLLDEFQAEKP